MWVALEQPVVTFKFCSTWEKAVEVAWESSTDLRILTLAREAEIGV